MTLAIHDQNVLVSNGVILIKYNGLGHWLCYVLITINILGKNISHKERRTVYGCIYISRNKIFPVEK